MGFGDELIHSFGGNVLCYGRSMMKPILLKVFADDLEPVLSWKQRAIAVASHNGDTEHVAAAQSILKESEWGLMQTPLDVPLIQFGRQVRRKRRWFHTCSGEHAAVLRGCQLRGWERVGYTLPHHPMFEEYLDVLRRTLGKGWGAETGRTRWVRYANGNQYGIGVGIVVRPLGDGKRR